MGLLSCSRAWWIYSRLLSIQCCNGVSQFIPMHSPTKLTNTTLLQLVQLNVIEFQTTKRNMFQKQFKHVQRHRHILPPQRNYASLSVPFKQNDTHRNSLSTHHYASIEELKEERMLLNKTAFKVNANYPRLLRKSLRIKVISKHQRIPYEPWSLQNEEDPFQQSHEKHCSYRKKILRRFSQK